MIFRIKYNYPFLTLLLIVSPSSLGTHSACQLSTADIRKTREWATNTFHSVQQSTIFVGMATRNILRIPINTDEVTWMLVAMMSSHQVPMILLGPARWTVIPRGHHQHWATWLDEADNAWRIMIMEISLKDGLRCDHSLDIQCRTRIRSSDGHFCTCHILDFVEGRGNSPHRRRDWSALHPLYLVAGAKLTWLIALYHIPNGRKKRSGVILFSWWFKR